MCYRSSSSVILINYSCVHNQIATFGLFSRQSVTLNNGLNIGCSHNRDNQPSEQSAKCNSGQALLQRSVKYDGAQPVTDHQTSAEILYKMRLGDRKPAQDITHVKSSQVNFRLMAEYNISVSRLTELHSRFTSNEVKQS